MSRQDNDSINPGHFQIRTILRLIGPTILVIAIIIGLIGFADFVSTMGEFGRQPTKFHYLFIAMPLAFIGITLTSAGFAGAVARYQAQEIAPVGKDTFNYLADGTREGVSTIAGAVMEGIRSADGQSSRTATAVGCPKCNTLNDEDARFCKSCGEALPKSQPCSACGEMNDPDAHFCDACGHVLRS